MSSPKFVVLKLRDLKLPGIMLLIAIAAFAFFMMSGKGDATAETFAPADSYEDGTYIASISLSDAEMDLVVNVKDHMIESISLDGFDENEKVIYEDLNYSISFVNDYVTSTQSLELPETNNITYSTSLLLDAVRVALSDDSDATVTSTYQAPLLENLSTDQNIVTDPQAELAEDDMMNEEAAEASSSEVEIEDATKEVTEEVTEEVVPEN